MLTCLDCRCTSEKVTMTTTSDRRDFKMFPRCPSCYEAREKRARRTISRYPEAFVGPSRTDDWGW